MERQVVFRVYGISILNGNKITLFESSSYDSAEQFAYTFDGAAEEIYIERVFVRTAHDD